jgi:CO/xanthine dehydrogenase Mo-binding subunit
MPISLNRGDRSSASVHLIEDGIAEVATGSPDIGGSRASMALMAAETLGVDYFQIHPSYVEGQIQGGVAQGIGWALNEEYIYDAKGRMDNAGFLASRPKRLRSASRLVLA